jgi:hypothetical protein
MDSRKLDMILVFVCLIQTNIKYVNATNQIFIVLILYILIQSTKASGFLLGPCIGLPKQVAQVLEHLWRSLTNFCTRMVEFLRQYKSS